MVPITICIVMVILLVGIYYLYLQNKKENYGVCYECGPPAGPYQLSVINPFVYPFSGSDDLAYLAREKNLVPDEPYPRMAPNVRSYPPMTNLTTPDHALLFGYTGDGVY